MPAIAPFPRAHRRSRAGLAAATAVLVALVCAAPASATFPGRNGRLVFVDGAGQIWTVVADGTGRTQLTNDAAYHYSPRWSPDGTRIVFYRGVFDANGMVGSYEVWVMNADGSHAHPVLHDPEHLYMEAAWSPDGRRLVFARQSSDPFQPSRDIFAVDLDGTHLGRLTWTGGEDAPDWSPDGERIAWTHYAGDLRPSAESRVWSMAVDGANKINLTPRGVTWPMSSSWLPDGRGMLLAGSLPYTVAGWTNLTSAIYVMGRSGADLRTLTSPATLDESAAVPSPDGRLVATVRSPRAGTDQGIAVANADGSTVRMVVRDPVSGVDWQPIPVAPQVTGAPAISGTPAVGSVLTAAPGRWVGAPTAFRYRWRLCATGVTACRDIPGATAAAYTVTSADAGSPLRLAVTAVNAAGETTVSSRATAPADA